MQRLDPDLLTHILHCMLSNGALLTPAHLRALNGLKAVSRTWARAVRHVLQQHAPSHAMLAVFRGDCEHTHPLTLPVRCRMNPYASTHGLTVLSVIDDFHILERCVEAVISELSIEAQPCEDDMAARFIDCPCTWHFEEVLGDAHDPALCLATLRISHIRIDIAGTQFTCIQDALQTEFSPTEIAHATDRGLCGQHALLLACMHLGHTFHNTWLSVNLLRVLRSLQDTRKNSILSFIATETPAQAQTP